MITKYIERVPRFLSLFGLLGLIGLAGFFNPQFSRFSALSFLSYLCYFRFLRWFIKPRPPIKSIDIFVPLLGGIIWITSEAFYPGLPANFPLFGFIGFAGFLGLYESANGPQRNVAA
jgi:hypothetical protein